MNKSIIIDQLQEILSEIENNDLLFEPLQKHLRVTEDELIHILSSQITDIEEA